MKTTFARSCARGCLAALLGLALVGTAAGAAQAGAGPVAATPTTSCGINHVTVPESRSLIPTTTYLTPGQSLWVGGTGEIWAGVKATGTNGPAGWTWTAGTAMPLPGARVFSLLARAGGAWTYVGDGATVVNYGSTTVPLELRINDDVPGNGSGSFTATYTTCATSDAPASPFSVSSVTARHSGKCLDVAYASTAHAADVIQGTCVGGTNQQWTPRPVGGGYYQLVARHSGKCLDVAYASTAHAADVIQGTCSGGANQHWSFRATSNGYYEIVARHSGKCLDVAYASTAHLANVIQGTCSLGTNQQWSFR